MGGGSEILWTFHQICDTIIFAFACFFALALSVLRHLVAAIVHTARNWVELCKSRFWSSSSSKRASSEQIPARKQEIAAKTREQQPKEWDVVGLGRAMVDISSMVEDDVLRQLHLNKGENRVINHKELAKVLRALKNDFEFSSAGSSLGNTLLTLSNLGNKAGFSIAMAGSFGKDLPGELYRSELLDENVHVLSKATGTTFTRITLTTPDSQRTVLRYEELSSSVQFDESLERALASSRFLVIEGWLWDIPGSTTTILEACEVARQANVQIALTASSVSCISRHREDFMSVLKTYANILFSNTVEARLLCDNIKESSPSLIAIQLTKFCRIVSVTDGEKGAYIAVKGSPVNFIPSNYCKPVDTAGAGDAYAAGVLCELLSGTTDFEQVGSFAAKIAALVVAQKGAHLTQEHARFIRSRRTI